MCGIAGIIDAACDTSAADLQALGRSMARTLQHRGPDDDGVWVDESFGIALGHRRLSVIDLSEAGHQPMEGSTGRYVVTFNGEIYNHRSLRRELESRSHVFRGDSDTEVLLAAVTEWELTGALERFNGMFALALWDRASTTLHLARDRVGEKPLYYGWAGRHFLFASELKAIRAHPDFSPVIDRDALALFLRYKYVPAPYSIYSGIRKLVPGHVLSIRQPVTAGSEGSPYPFWSAAGTAERGASHPFVGSIDDAAEELESLLADAVRLRMVADVPVGAFLSGGIDSSTVVALMQASSERPVRTFTIGNPDAAWDESTDAKAVSDKLGTDHTSIEVTAADALAVLPSLPSVYDEPFADSSQVPTMLVSQLARQDVTVSLSGDGGDELFGGYNRHLWGRRASLVVRHTPRMMRAVSASALAGVSADGWDRIWRRAAPVLPQGLRPRNPGQKLHKLARVLRADQPEDTYRMLVSHWLDPTEVVRAATEPPTILATPDVWPRLGDDRRTNMWLDAVTYLPGDILTKLDRASMAVGLEARVPFLDHRVVEFAWSLPPGLTLSNRSSKPVLRRLLGKYLPSELVERPKMGFGVPIDQWLRGPLREWAEDLLDERRLVDEGYFEPAPIRRRWDALLAGSGTAAYELWDVLTFQAWLQSQVPN